MAVTGIQIPTNFALQAKLLLDFRGSFASVADMKAFATTSLATGQITYCIAERQLYIYDDSNTDDATTGKWSKLEGGAGIEDWVANKSYAVEDIVLHDDKLYICKTVNNDATFTLANWKCLTSSAITDWVASTDYFVGDLVINGTNLFKCTTVNNDATFTAANWQVIGDAGNFITVDKFSTLSAMTSQPNTTTMAYILADEQIVDTNGDPVVDADGNDTYNPAGFYIYIPANQQWTLIFSTGVSIDADGSITDEPTVDDYEDMFG